MVIKISDKKKNSLRTYPIFSLYKLKPKNYRICENKLRYFPIPFGKKPFYIDSHTINIIFIMLITCISTELRLFKRLLDHVNLK